MGDSGVLVAGEGAGFVRLLRCHVLHVENHPDNALIRQRVEVAGEDYNEVAPLTAVSCRPVENEFTQMLHHVEALSILQVVHTWMEVKLC